VLLDENEGLTRESYNKFVRLDEQTGDWPYGGDVMVHAVGKNSENYKVEIKMQVKTPHKSEATHKY